MAFYVNKDKLLRVLRSDITGLELKSGHSDPLLLEESTATSNSSNSRPTSPESIDNVVIHTHEDVVSSLTKQLEIQQQVNEICEQDLQYRTEIIELLSSRVTQLELEAASWEQQKHAFALLKEKAGHLQNGDETHNKSEPTSKSSDITPEGHVLIESSHLDSLKTQIATSNAELEDWNIRVEGLELHLRKEKELKSTLKSELARTKEEYEASQKSSEQTLQDLRTQISKLETSQVDATTQNRELNKSIEAANERISRLVLDIVTAEETRDSALASASAETRDYATLRGRLSELEGQLAISEQEKEELSGKLFTNSSQLAETNEKLSNANDEISRFESELISARALISQLQKSIAEAAEISKKDISELQKKLQNLTSDGESRITALQEQLSLVQGERNSIEKSISLLKAKIGQYEEHAEKDATLIRELEQNSSTLVEQVTVLEADLAAANKKHEELIVSKEASETALQQEMAALQTKVSEDASKSTNRMSELESKIVFITQQCELHTVELTQAKEALTEKDGQLSKLPTLEHQVEDMKNTLREREQASNGLQEQLSAAENKIQDFEERQTIQVNELEQLKKDHLRTLAEYEGRLAEMTTGATTNASRHAVLENEVSSLTAKLLSLEADLLAAQSERDRLRKEHEEYVDSTANQHDSEMFDTHRQMESLEGELKASREACEALEAQLTEMRQSSSTEGSGTSESEKQLENSLREAEDKIIDLQLELETKISSLGELESRANKAAKLESQLERLNEEFASTRSKNETEMNVLRTQVANLNTQIALSEQAHADLKLDLEKAGKEIDERQVRIHILEKEARDNDAGGRSSVDYTELERLRTQHEKDIIAMEEALDEIRIERDGLSNDRDDAMAARDEQIARVEELQKRVQDLESGQAPTTGSQLSVSSPTDIIDLNSPKDLVQELQFRLRESEEKREAAERALLSHRRSSSMATNISGRSRDSMILVEDIDEHGNSEIREIKRIETDAGSDTASDITAETSMLASLSMASTTSSQAEFEAAKARADQADNEGRRLSLNLFGGKDKEQVTPEKSKRLSRHDSTRSSHSGLSIAAALGGAGRMVSNIAHGESSHLFPQLERKRTVSGSSHKSKDHHDMSNPFMFFAGRDRADSQRSPLSVSTSTTRSNSGAVPTSPPKAVSPPPHTPTSAMLERERKTKEKAEKAERERAEKAAKIERERIEKAEKAARKEKERLDKEQREKEKKARAKRESISGEGVTAMRQGASSYYTTT